MKENNRIIVDEPKAFPLVAAEWIADRLGEIVAQQGRCTVALAGGETPRSIYKLLATPAIGRRVEWQKTVFYFGDERCVPPDHPDSNYRMARESLFSIVPIAPEQIHRIRGELSDRDRAATEY